MRESESITQCFFSECTISAGLTTGISCTCVQGFPWYDWSWGDLCRITWRYLWSSSWPKWLVPRVRAMMWKELISDSQLIRPKMTFMTIQQLLGNDSIILTFRSTGICGTIWSNQCHCSEHKHLTTFHVANCWVQELVHGPSSQMGIQRIVGCLPALQDSFRKLPIGWNSISHCCLPRNQGFGQWSVDLKQSEAWLLQTGVHDSFFSVWPR